MSSRIHIVGLAAMAAILAAPAKGVVPPSPEAKAKFIAEGTWEEKAAILRAFQTSIPPDWYESGSAAHKEMFRANAVASPDNPVTFRVCVLLVEFPDFKHDDAQYFIPGGGSQPCYTVGTPFRFDSLLFSEQATDSVFNPTGSMTEYYLEISYGNYYIVGDVQPWVEAPDTYASYVGSGSGLGGGGARLAHDAVIAADDAGVNFQPYGNGGSSVRGLIIIHAGPGAEQRAYGIWSHSSSMSPGVSVDGVSLSRYAMQPEETVGSDEISSVGVFCHEWGHVLGAADYYDPAYNLGSEGLGSWCLMAGGSWNNGGRRPAHPNGWVRTQDFGFANLQVLLQNIRQAEIPQVETSPTVFMLKMNPSGPNPQFWIVENRQRVGFDSFLPGGGLLIYHYDVDGSQSTPDRYRLAVEEADGRRDLAFGGSGGQASDPFPGFPTNNRNFHNYTTPNSKTNDSGATQVSVLNISDSGPNMRADLNIYHAIPWLLLDGDSLDVFDSPGGNGDGIYGQGETLDIYLEVRNIMKETYWPTLHLDVSNPDLEILTNDKNMGVALNPATVTNRNFEPIRVRIPDEFISSLVTFTLTVISDSTLSTNDNTFRNTFEFEIRIGAGAQVLLVDDDNGDGIDRSYRDALDRMGLLYDRWDKKVQGSPVYASLTQYPVVFWMTGSYWPGQSYGGTLTSADVTYLKALLDNGGNLLMASPAAPVQLRTLDSAFMADYLHANVTGSAGSVTTRTFLGAVNNIVGGGLKYTTRNGIIWDETTPIMQPMNGGQAVFTLIGQTGTGNFGNCGIIYDGSYRSVFLSFAVEYLDSALMASGWAPPDSLINRVVRFFVRGAATAVDDQPTDNLLPSGFTLDQNYPNPFNPSTTISYQLSEVGSTTLTVYNVLGQRVATLLDQVQGPGQYRVEWRGRDDRGSQVASGVYFYRLTYGADSQTKKMMLVK
ncbi:MAG: M6 family metalloprotease domain-containing protein [Candidatus Zixiibacteriota bacterium]